MKKLIYLFIVIILTSCHYPKYIHSGSTNSRLNLNQGKWLLNKISAPKTVIHNITHIANEEFSELLGDRFTNLTQTNNILFPFNNTDNFTKATLKDIKNGSNDDYFINITSKTINNEINFLQMGKVEDQVKNTIEITLDIYDLKLLDRFYSQTVIGELTIQNDNADFSFAKGTNEMTAKGLKRIFKKIKKNAIK